MVYLSYGADHNIIEKYGAVLGAGLSQKCPGYFLVPYQLWFSTTRRLNCFLLLCGLHPRTPTESILLHLGGDPVQME